MLFDLILLAILILAAVRGYKRGFIYQLANVVALFAVYLFAKPAASQLSEIIFDKERFRGFAISLLISSALIVLLVKLISHILLKNVVNAFKATKVLNASLGAAVGTLLSFFLLFLALCVLDVFREPMIDKFPNAEKFYTTSFSMPFVHENNVLPDLKQTVENAKVSQDYFRLRSAIALCQKDSSPNQGIQSEEAAPETMENAFGGRLMLRHFVRTMPFLYLTLLDQNQNKSVIQSDQAIYLYDAREISQLLTKYDKFASLCQDYAKRPQEDLDNHDFLLDSRVVSLLWDVEFNKDLEDQLCVYKEP